MSFHGVSVEDVMQHVRTLYQRLESNANSTFYQGEGGSWALFHLISVFWKKLKTIISGSLN